MPSWKRPGSSGAGWSSAPSICARQGTARTQALVQVSRAAFRLRRARTMSPLCLITCWKSVLSLRWVSVRMLLSPRQRPPRSWSHTSTSVRFYLRTAPSRAAGLVSASCAFSAVLQVHCTPAGTGIFHPCLSRFRRLNQLISTACVRALDDSMSLVGEAALVPLPPFRSSRTQC